VKQIVILCLCTVLAMGASKKGSSKGYQGWGIGAGISLAIPNDGHSFDSWYNDYYWDHYWNGYAYYNGYWWGCQGVGPGAELKGVVRFGIGKAGSIHYVPNLSYWGRWEDVNFRYSNRNDDIKLHDHQVNINITDARWIPPVPRSFAIKPYVGFGLLNFDVYTWKEKSTVNNWENKDTDFQIHQNLFLGAEFQLDGKVWPYVEFKLSNGAVGDFLMTAGFTIQGKK